MSESGTPASSAPRKDDANEFDFDRLRRRPDIEAENLFAVDASDRLILDEAAGALAAYRSGGVVVLEDRYGALTLGAAALHDARSIRVYQDALSGEYALDSNASGVNLTDAYRSLPLGEELLKDAHVVLLQLPKSLDALDEIAGAIAKYAAPDVIVFAGGRIKHMTVSMNEVLRRHFGALNVRPARQKSRVLIASAPLAAEATDRPHTGWPHTERHDDVDLTVRGHGGVFAGTSIDIGTRALLEVLDRMKPDAERAIDLGCGTGVLAAALAAQRPLLRVLATDQSAVAVASARATIDANALAERVTVVRADGLSGQADDSADLILLNPPFHIGASVHAGLAEKLFIDAARVLAPGGELWTVWNTHLGYRPMLTRIVGSTRQVGRNTKFTVTVSTGR
ncbi:class I SAM-dependent methyltransferase [Cryobacterium sp. Y11]|uniref:class I SAM-dependent methyltransferase n=1 Tax=Cryobacterium sp. Y11 TaxID=2045016 RepID=UPI000CE54BDC|nr:class I SAM-dependent methyltransferase [Cryobacterium sp. Y11]